MPRPPSKRPPARRQPSPPERPQAPRPSGRRDAPPPAWEKPQAKRGAKPERRPGPAPERRPGPAPERKNEKPMDRAAEAPRGPRRLESRLEAKAERRAEAARAPLPDRTREMTPSGNHWLHGLHAVAAALANPRRGLKRLLVTEEAEAALAARLPKPWRIQAERADKSRFQTFLPEDAVHQGAALLVEPLPGLRLEEAITRRPGPVLLLDQVTDPRNVGAILRSAAAFGAACVVMQDRHAPPETGSLARAASGALEVVPVVREVNLARTIATLQRAGFWVLGLAGDAARPLAEAAPRDRRVALVLGAEESGMRRLQRETVDELVRLPISAEMESLNVSAAAAVALYELVRGEEAP